MKILFDPDDKEDPAKYPSPIFPAPLISDPRLLYPRAAEFVALAFVPSAHHPNAIFERIPAHHLPSRSEFTSISPPFISTLYPAVGMGVPIPITDPSSKMFESTSPFHQDPNFGT